MMNPKFWVDLAKNFGVPVIVMVALGWFVLFQYEEHKAEREAWSLKAEASEKNTLEAYSKQQQAFQDVIKDEQKMNRETLTRLERTFSEQQRLNREAKKSLQDTIMQEARLNRESSKELSDAVHALEKTIMNDN